MAIIQKSKECSDAIVSRFIQIVVSWKVIMIFCPGFDIFRFHVGFVGFDHEILLSPIYFLWVKNIFDILRLVFLFIRPVSDANFKISQSGIQKLLKRKFMIVLISKLKSNIDWLCVIINGTVSHYMKVP